MRRKGTEPAAGMPLMGLTKEAARIVVSKARKRELDAHRWTDTLEKLSAIKFDEIEPDTFQPFFDMYGRCIGLTYRLKGHYKRVS